MRTKENAFTNLLSMFGNFSFQSIYVIKWKPTWV